MATFAEIRTERKNALRYVRRTQRAFDTELERMERTIFRLLDRKTVLTGDDALRISRMWNAVNGKARDFEKGLAEFYTVVSS